MADTQIAELDNNLYYMNTGAATENLVNVFGTNYTSATLRSKLYNGSDSFSRFANPNFVSNTNLRLALGSDADGRAKLIPSITDDIDKQPRSNMRDIGADDSTFIRTATNCYIANGSLTETSVTGSAWRHFYDTLGKIIFSLNPVGNNLGDITWGIYINPAGSALRSDSVYNNATGQKYKAFFMDRNLFINVQNQPTSPVSIKIYAATQDFNKLNDSVKLFTGGINMNAYDVKIHKYHDNSNTASCTPNNSVPTGGDSSTFLFNLANINTTGAFGERLLHFQTGSFSQFNPFFSPGGGQFLPVTWASFNARANGMNADLEWSTGSERNNNHFEVERSLDGKSYEVIAKVKAVGESKITTYYTSVDENAATLGSKVYYRIKQVDNDGLFSYSKTKVVIFGDVKVVVNQITPNPFTDHINIDYTATTNDDVQLTLIDLTGKEVFSTVLKSTIGENGRRVEIPGLSSGAYILKVTLGEQTSEHKIIKE
jgi:hypothetical protein